MGAFPFPDHPHASTQRDFLFSPLNAYVCKQPFGIFWKLWEGAWMSEASPALRHLLQLLSQPGWQRLPEPVQQPGEPQVVGPVVAGQEGSALGGRESTLCLTV